MRDKFYKKNLEWNQYNCQQTKKRKKNVKIFYECDKNFGSIGKIAWKLVPHWYWEGAENLSREKGLCLV